MNSNVQVVVIGAGVTGLQIAVLLAEAGYRVSIIAAHVPGDESIEYTSPWAGAQWRTHATPDEPEQCKWDVETLEYWVELLEKEKKNKRLPKSGLKMYQSLHYWDSDPTEFIWWAPYVQEFRTLEECHEPIASCNERTPKGSPTISCGAACKAISINVSQYLLYLHKRLQSLGVKVIKARLPTDNGFEAALKAAEDMVGADKVDCFVNATGLGAAKLCNDEAMFPIRGQTVLVKGEAEALRTRIGEGYTSYCIPRPGAGVTILGGTKEVGIWSETPELRTTQKILERAKIIAPELCTGQDGGFEVISVQCGLRPGRKGGPRIEREVVGGRQVVHAYGHAGAGYQNSIGSARATLRLVEEALGGRSGIRAKL